MKTPLQKYETACNNLMIAFLNKYYCDEDTKLGDLDYYWIADEVAGVLSVGDEFWNIDDMANAMRYNPTHDQLFAYYYHHLDAYDNPKIEKYNMKAYLKLKIYDK